MKLITRDTDYAIRAICFIAGKKGEVVSVSGLVKQTKIPRPFLRKILQELNKEGILHSYKGKGGGFILAKAADKIYLADVARVFQGELAINECIFRKRICPSRNRCMLRTKLNQIEDQVLKKLRGIRLSSLM